MLARKSKNQFQTHPRRRVTDTGWYVLRDWYRDLVPVLSVVIASIALIGLENKVERNREGRKIALQVVCAVASTQNEGARTILLASAALPGDKIVGDFKSGSFQVVSGPFAKFLEARGFPGPRKRVSNAQAAAVAYALDTTAGIKQIANIPNIVDKTGRLNCSALQKAAKTAK